MQIAFKFENYELLFDDSIKYETFKEKDYAYGIIFYFDEAKYELIHNYVGLTRLIINRPNWHWTDFPFNMGTVSFLPEGIEVKEVMK